MRLTDIGELGLIERLAALAGREGDGLVRGIGDDAAVLRWPAGELLLATCDAAIEGVHFRAGRSLPGLPEAGYRGIGRRVAAVNLSDVAAMGGRPRFALASLAAPEDTDLSCLEELYAGLAGALEEAGALLVGGNTARAPERLWVDVFLLGQVEPAGLLRRDGARPGDAVCLTGDVGAAAAGLALLEAAAPGVVLEGAARQAARRHLAPVPRLAAGRILGASGAVTACLDVSDGLLRDAGHLARASGVAIRIDAESIPVSAVTREACAIAGIDALETAATGGEDFELLCTVRPGAVGALARRLEAEAGLPLTVIGEVAAGEPAVVARRGGEPWHPAREGFEHFGRPAAVEGEP